MSEHGDKAVVFAYSDVGVRGLQVLLAHGVDVRLVVTHADDPAEHVWFESVAALAERAGIDCVAPASVNDPVLLDNIRAIEPDWFFSLYYRHILGRGLLAVPARGAFNLHGSLLPRYRGRAPVNWAVLHGETETGASLHHMTAQPDAGDLVDQLAVPILPNDTALDVHRKVTWAAEQVLHRSLDELLTGGIAARPLELERGSYFGGRTQKDGRVDWSKPAQDLHNLIRAVAPPYPGAFADTHAGQLRILGSYFRDEPSCSRGVRIYWTGRRCWADCCDGKRFEILGLDLAGRPLDRGAFEHRFGAELRFGTELGCA